MGSALHLLLLSLCVGMIHGDAFTVSQPDRLEGVEGGSIEIPCTFTYPDTHKPTGYDIAWRRNEFHGEFILNKSRGYTHPEYRGRIEFLGDPAKERTGTIRIKQLRTRDTNRYFCRLTTTGNRYAVWQSVSGTYLTVRGMIHGDGFTVSQPGRLEGVEGGSIEIPCTFTYPDTLKPTGYDIAWRRNEFHGEFILNMSQGYTHPEYRGRIEFRGDPAKERTGTIRIKQLRTRDTNRYFCRLTTTGNRYAVWQSVSGTYLTVRALRPETTTDHAPSSVSAASQHSVDGGDPLPQGLILIIKAGIAVTILATVWLVGMCLMKRKEVTDSSDGNLCGEAK